MIISIVLPIISIMLSDSCILLPQQTQTQSRFKAPISQDRASVEYTTVFLSLTSRDLPDLSLKSEEIISLRFLAFLWGPDLFD